MPSPSECRRSAGEEAMKNAIPVKHDVRRQFLRIVSSGVHGREDYFTTNPLVAVR